MIRHLQRSFGGGEIAPELLGRLDLNHYQTGLELCRNFYTLPHGPAANRPGFQIVNECMGGGTTPVNLIPFVFNTSQAYILEFGNLYMRVHTEGGTILETASAVSGATQANPVVVTQTGHGYSNGDEIYLTGLGGMTEVNGRYFKITGVTTNTYQLQDLQGNNIDGTGYTAYTSGGTGARVYTLVTPYLEADLFSINYEQSADVMTLVHPSYAPRELKRLGAASWSLNTITFGPGISNPSTITATATVGSGGFTHYYRVTAVDQDNLEESLALAEASVSNDLTVAGNYNTISWSSVANAVRYNVYKRDRLSSGTLGYIGQTSGLSFIDDNISPDFLQTPPENQTPFSGAGNYPSTVTYFEQRKVFGGTDNDPQAVHMTRSGTEANLSRSIPSRDDDAIAFALASRQYNRVRHLVPISDLLLFTTGGEWKVTAQNSDAITPSTIWVRPQSYIGAANIKPIVAGGSILFIANLGGHIHDISYSFELDSYQPRDISIVGPHLFDGYTMKDWALTTSPYQMVFAVRSDGALIGLTYLPDQSPPILGWHQHTTRNGTFESVASIPESNGETMLYAVIKRKINGVDRRFIERMHTRDFSTVENAFFVDAGLSHDVPVTISGATRADPVVITAAGHGFSNGDTVRIRDVVGMTELNQKSFTVANATANTFELQTDDATPVNIDGTGYTAYVSGGTAREEKTKVTNLHHLEGETVAILADGNVEPQKKVVNGAVTLTKKASIIHVGLPVTADLRTLPLVFEQVPGFGQGLAKNVLSAFLRVDRSRGYLAGPDTSHLRQYAQRTNENWGEFTRLVTGEIELMVDGSWGRSGQVSVRQTDPLPLTILSMGMEVKIES